MRIWIGLTGLAAYALGCVIFALGLVDLDTSEDRASDEPMILLGAGEVPTVEIGPLDDLADARPSFATPCPPGGHVILVNKVAPSVTPGCEGPSRKIDLDGDGFCDGQIILAGYGVFDIQAPCIGDAGADLVVIEPVESDEQRAARLRLEAATEELKRFLADLRRREAERP